MGERGHDTYRDFILGTADSRWICVQPESCGPSLTRSGRQRAIGQAATSSRQLHRIYEISGRRRKLLDGSSRGDAVRTHIALPQAASTIPVAVRLCGAFEVHSYQRRLIVPPSTERVIAFMALKGLVSRTLVAGTLWPERPEGQASACLRTALWRIRKLCQAMITCQGEAIGFLPHVDVDVAEFVDTARCVIKGGTPHTGIWHAVELMSRDLLPGWYDDWVAVERNRLRQLRLHALETLATRLSVQGRYGDALEVALQTVAAEPLRESAHRILTEVHLAEGRVVQHASCTSGGGDCSTPSSVSDRPHNSKNYSQRRGEARDDARPLPRRGKVRSRRWSAGKPLFRLRSENPLRTGLRPDTSGAPQRSDL